jgi:hypothetical protein
LNLEEYLLEKGQVGVWLGRKDSYLPFMESNVFLGNKPDKLLLNFDKGKIEVEGEMMTMKELCQFSKLDADQLLLMIYELGTTDDLLFNLLEK